MKYNKLDFIPLSGTDCCTWRIFSHWRVQRVCKTISHCDEMRWTWRTMLLLGNHWHILILLLAAGREHLCRTCTGPPRRGRGRAARPPPRVTNLSTLSPIQWNLIQSNPICSVTNNYKLLLFNNFPQQNSAHILSGWVTAQHLVDEALCLANGIMGTSYGPSLRGRQDRIIVGAIPHKFNQHR